MTSGAALGKASSGAGRASSKASQASRSTASLGMVVVGLPPPGARRPPFKGLPGAPGAGGGRLARRRPPKRVPRGPGWAQRGAEKHIPAFYGKWKFLPFAIRWLAKAQPGGSAPLLPSLLRPAPAQRGELAPTRRRQPEEGPEP